MIPINFLRLQPLEVKKGLERKNFTQISLVDEILDIDAARRTVQTSLEEVFARSNAAAREIGGLMREGKKEEAEKVKANVTELKQQEKELKEKVEELEKEQQLRLVQLPNLPVALVPVGKGAEDNEVVREGGKKPELPAGARPHWELIKTFDLIDFEAGVKLTGSGFPVYIGQGARLQRALTSFFLDYNIAAGYKEYAPPYMVNEESAYATGQLPDKEGQMYHITADGFYLIPTAEVPVTNLYRDSILKADELPVKMTAYSHCYRREAGSFGANVRGLNRVHEFEKVELVQITEPEMSGAALDEMVAHVEGLVKKLELPYRILRLCGGDMSFASAITYDFEVWSAAQEKWLEVSSVSNFTDFQANRLRCRYKNAEGKTRLCHTLNGSSLALPRIVAALLENNQDGQEIKLPAALHPYFGTDTIKS